MRNHVSDDVNKYILKYVALETEIYDNGCKKIKISRIKEGISI